MLNGRLVQNRVEFSSKRERNKKLSNLPSLPSPLF